MDFCFPSPFSSHVEKKETSVEEPERGSLPSVGKQNTTGVNGKFNCKLHLILVRDEATLHVTMAIVTIYVGLSVGYQIVFSSLLAFRCRE